MIGEMGFCFLELGHACVFLLHQRSLSFLKKSLQRSKFRKQWLVGKILDIFNMIISFVLALLLFLGVTRKYSLNSASLNKASQCRYLKDAKPTKVF